jgi:apolipoprotein D and lipocalin family protein
MKKIFVFLGISLILLLLASCKSIPEGATAVVAFDLDKYLGTWYEMARIDFKFERDLNNTTATYSMLPNGKVKVLNRGYNVKDKKWQDVEGKAKFRGEQNLAELEVSFFGPFYAGYNVVGIEGDYEYALVAGSNTDYLWILSRTKSIPKAIKDKFLQEAKKVGYDTSRLLWVKHD